MPTSSATAGSQSKAMLLVALAALLIGVIAAAGFVVFRATSSDTVALQSVAEPVSPPLTDPTAVGEPSDERDAEPEPADAEQAVPTDPASQEQGAAGDPIAAAYDDIWQLRQQYLGGSDPVGVMAALTDHVGAFPATDDAALASFGLEVDREVRERVLRIQYRAAVRYYSQQSVDEVLDLYRTELPLLDLAERESETGSDDDGDFTDVDFGSFSSHPDPLIWWANLSLQVRADASGTLVRIYYTVTRTDDAVVDGLLADIEAGLPLADGYENTSVAVSGFALDPYEKPMTFSINMVATASLEAVTTSESDELARLADVASATGNWVLDEQTESGVWMDNTSVGDLRNYLTLRLTDTETIARYSYS